MDIAGKISKKGGKQMTKEDKQLLLKDLCMRIPYRTFVCLNPGAYNKPETCILTGVDGEQVYLNVDSDPFRIDHIKPYIRPMSSMMEEELNECVCQSGIKDIECPNWQDIPKEKQFEARLNHAIAVFLTDSNNIDWLLAHHFDFRGLIEKGLALEAPEGVYKTQ